MSGFGLKQLASNVPVKHYYIEYKYALPETKETLEAHADEVEEVIKTVNVYLPVLKDAVLEERWLMSLIQVFLSTEEAKQLGINQAFVFQYDPKREAVKNLVLRMQTENFTDEESQFLDSPDVKQVVNWRSRLNVKFKLLYGLSLPDWFDAQKVTF